MTLNAGDRVKVYSQPSISREKVYNKITKEDIDQLKHTLTRTCKIDLRAGRHHAIQLANAQRCQIPHLGPDINLKNKESEMSAHVKLLTRWK